MSSTPAFANQDRDEQLLFIGKQCSHSSCTLVDFLPFKCHHCQEAFCQEHFLVDAHSCPNFDASKHNRVAPSCPLCNEPVAVKPGQDPNDRMEQHFQKECSVMTGKTTKKSAPTCARERCGKLLFAPIKCDKCRKEFCPSHRFPSDHSCVSASTPAAARRAGGVPAASRLLAQNTKSSATNAANAANAAVGAIKKSISSTPSFAPSTSSSSSTKQSTAMPNLFSKTDRRAKAERESRRRALQERAKKGLLSEEEKARFAAEEAEWAKESEKKGDCVLM